MQFVICHKFFNLRMQAFRVVYFPAYVLLLLLQSILQTNTQCSVQVVALADLWVCFFFDDTINSRHNETYSFGFRCTFFTVVFRRFNLILAIYLCTKCLCMKIFENFQNPRDSFFFTLLLCFPFVVVYCCEMIFFFIASQACALLPQLI